ncbi:MAG: lamin tail domain-containing protein [Spirochaetales bacterium]|nr:lamin tail domain-containing protein [Spirochaetales bacterium]
MLHIGVHYDPENNDNENLNEEYFALQNITDNPLKLGGWLISAANGKHTYQIPKGFVLESGKLVYIFYISLNRKE